MPFLNKFFRFVLIWTAVLAVTVALIFVAAKSTEYARRQDWQPLSEENAFWFVAVLFAIVLILWALRGPWHLFQGCVFLAVVGSNIHWQWTPNKFLAAAIGIVAGIGATAALSWTFGLLRRLKLWPSKDRVD